MTEPVDQPVPDAGPSLPRRGYVDAHNHLLPGIDDGCRDVDESLECIRVLMQRGYTAAVCTPHGGPPRFMDNTPRRVETEVSSLQQHLDAAGLDFQLLPGSELSLSRDLVDWLEDVGVQSLGRPGDASGGSGGAVLFDYWGDHWTEECDAFVDFLLASNLTPVLAHPERMALHDSWIERMTNLRQRGVLLQGNLRALTGGDGLMTQTRVTQLLDLNAYTMMSLDAHRRSCLKSRLEGMARLHLGWGRRRVQAMLADGPRDLVALSREHTG